jgi:hypothetical protein
MPVISWREELTCPKELCEPEKFEDGSGPVPEGNDGREVVPEFELGE